MAHQVTEGEYLLSKHLIAINKKILDLAAGRIKRLIINMPPQHGKSDLICKYTIPWWFGHFPNEQIMLVAYQASYAAELGGKAREFFNEYGKELFGLSLKKNKGSDYRWYIDKYAGSLKATGIGGDITGRPANLLIFDDPIKNHEHALSKTWRDKTFEFFRGTAYPRLAPNAKIIIIMTRWTSDDLTGRIISGEYGFGKDWDVLTLPAIALDNDPLGREKGDVLFPERYDNDAIEDRKKVLGTYWFSAQYQQEPIAGEWQIFKPQWWNFYDSKPDCPYIIQTWDTAFKQGDANSYSVCETWGLSNEKLFLLDRWRDKVNFPDLLRIAKTQYNMWQPRYVLIEDAASGQDLIPALKKTTKIKIKEVKTMNKEVRAHLASPTVEEGRVYLPSSAPWLAEFINEHSEFPNGAFSDQVDTSTMAILHLKDIKTSRRPAQRTRSERTREQKFHSY